MPIAQSVSAGLDVGFALEWTRDIPSRAFEFKSIKGMANYIQAHGSPEIP